MIFNWFFVSTLLQRIINRKTKRVRERETKIKDGPEKN